MRLFEVVNKGNKGCRQDYPSGFRFVVLMSAWVQCPHHFSLCLLHSHHIESCLHILGHGELLIRLVLVFSAP